MRDPWKAYTETGVPISALSKKEWYEMPIPWCADIIFRYAIQDETGKSISGALIRTYAKVAMSHSHLQRTHWWG